MGALGDVQGARILDLGCGKGRFARRLRDLGSEVVGLDPSAGMLAHAGGLSRVMGSATRLPFPPRRFDAIVAVEVFEHLHAPGLDAALGECLRVLRPGGLLAIVDKNVYALDPLRPWLPRLAVKRLDERRGLWMYPVGGPVRERWFRPGGLSRRLAERFEGVRVEFPISPEESAWAVFRRVPRLRAMALWTARAPGGRDG